MITNPEIERAVPAGNSEPEKITNIRITPQKKYQYLAPSIFFLVLGAVFIWVGSQHGGFSKAYIVGALVVNLLLTGIFYLVSIFIRKIANKFGRKWQIILWVIVAILFFGGIWFYIMKQKPPYILFPNGSVIVTEKISLDECINTKDDIIKYACGTKYAISLKDRSLCQKVYGSNSVGYYCESNYDAYYHTGPMVISDCQSMVVNDQYDLFYKDRCVWGVAIPTFNKQICGYLSKTDEQKNCVASIDAEQFKKDKVCGPLYADGKMPSHYECDEYVFSQHDLVKCSLVTPAWNKEACTKYVNNFMATKGEYDAVKQSKPTILSIFDNTPNLKNCSYTSVGPGTPDTYSSNCMYWSDQNSMTLKFTNKTQYPLLFSQGPIDVYDTTGYITKTCQNPLIKEIDGGNNFSVQIDKGEAFILRVACSSGTLGEVSELLIGDQITGSGQNTRGSLRVDFKK